MAWIRWCVPREDLDQERALAIIEGRDPTLSLHPFFFQCERGTVVDRARHFRAVLGMLNVKVSRDHD
jgi:hypothetical protein